MPKRTNRHTPNWLIFIGAILFIVLIYIVYTASFGQVDITANSPHKGESLADRKRKAEKEHQRLMRKIAMQEELKAKLRKKFRWIYLLGRMSLPTYLLHTTSYCPDLISIPECGPGFY